MESTTSCPSVMYAINYIMYGMTYPGSLKETPMSFREKSAWACLVTTLVVFVPYFATIFRHLAKDELHPGSVLGAFVGAVVFAVLLNTSAHIALAIHSKQEVKDE